MDVMIIVLLSIVVTELAYLCYKQSDWPRIIRARRKARK